MKQRIQRIVFNHDTNTVQFWQLSAPYVREYRSTERIRARIEACLGLGWEYHPFKSMEIYSFKPYLYR